MYCQERIYIFKILSFEVHSDIEKCHLINILRIIFFSLHPLGTVNKENQQIQGNTYKQLDSILNNPKNKDTRDDFKAFTTNGQKIYVFPGDITTMYNDLHEQK